MERRQNPEAGAGRALGIILVGSWIPKVDQQPVAQILRDMSFVTIDDRRAGLLVGTYDLPQLFGIEAFGEGSGAHQITEHHRELAALGFGCSGPGLRSRRRRRSTPRLS